MGMGSGLWDQHGPGLSEVTYRLGDPGKFTDFPNGEPLKHRGNGTNFQSCWRRGEIRDARCQEQCWVNSSCLIVMVASKPFAHKSPSGEAFLLTWTSGLPHHPQET